MILKESELHLFLSGFDHKGLYNEKTRVTAQKTREQQQEM